MASKLVAAAVCAVLAISLLGAASAGAATEFGDSCTADRGSSGTQLTLFSVSSPDNPLPLAAPTAGVITSWKLQLVTPEPPQAPIGAVIPQTLKVLRLNTAAKTAQVVGVSSGTIGSGLNTIAARIPVQAGDRLSLFGSGKVPYEEKMQEFGTLYCETVSAPTDVYGGFYGDAPIGASPGYMEVSGPVRVPAAAVLEPDADNDGFGDESQDQCPQSASSQVACPRVKLSASATAKRKSVSVLVTSTVAAKVTVTGKAALGKGKKAKLKAKPKNVKPGAFAKFKLTFSSALTKRLEELTPKQSLTLKVTSSAANLVGKPTKKTIKVKLKGTSA